MNLEEVSKLPVEEGSVSELMHHTHELAAQNPMMSKDELKALKKDIEDNGQLLPIIVYRRKVVDGRNRLEALLMLNRDKVNYISLPNNLSLIEVSTVVNSTSVRRNLTSTQKTIKAYKHYKARGGKREDVALANGISISNLDALIACMESKKYLTLSDIQLDSLFKGEKMMIDNGKTTDSLKAIQMWLKTQQTRVADFDEIFANTSKKEKTPEFVSAMAITGGDVKRIKGLIDDLKIAIGEEEVISDELSEEIDKELRAMHKKETK